jgi:hypothetical protein
VLEYDRQFTKLVQAELDTLRAVSTVPPRTTSFMVSTTPEPPRGPRTDFSASIREQEGSVAEMEGDGVISLRWEMNTVRRGYGLRASTTWWLRSWPSGGLKMKEEEDEVGLSRRDMECCVRRYR